MFCKAYKGMHFISFNLMGKSENMGNKNIILINFIKTVLLWKHISFGTKKNQ